jgi:phosphoribosylanthranilate isomerase
MAITVKVCGINSLEAAEASIAAGVDLVGLNFHPASPRFVQEDQAREFAERMRGHTRLVALFGDARDDQIERVVALIRPDFLQLCGSETPERAAQLRERFRVGIIKTFPVQTRQDLVAARRYAEVAEFFHFDAKPPAKADRPGGHGVPFDWRILEGASFARPWLLAGGLTPENVERAIAISRATGVDVSSGVESAPGKKSPELIDAFVLAAKRAPFRVEEGA